MPLRKRPNGFVVIRVTTVVSKGGKEVTVIDSKGAQKNYGTLLDR